VLLFFFFFLFLHSTHVSLSCYLVEGGSRLSGVRIPQGGCYGCQSKNPSSLLIKNNNNKRILRNPHTGRMGGIHKSFSSDRSRRVTNMNFCVATCVRASVCMCVCARTCVRLYVCVNVCVSVVRAIIFDFAKSETKTRNSPYEKTYFKCFTTR
jgi:hypothetical protein